MHYKNIFLIIIIITFIATLFVSVKQPKLHKVALIYNSDYALVKKDYSKEEINETIPTINQKEEKTTVQEKLKENTEKYSNLTPKKQTVVKKDNVSAKKNTVAKVPDSTKQTVAKTTIKNNPKVQKDEQKKTASTSKQKEVKKEQEIPKVITVEKVQPQKTVVLTKEQEEIAWNVWRSNIQNQIMKDTHLPTIPNGTVFRFKFDVDKYGKVSNIQTYSDNVTYTPYAIQYIAPVIRSYQGKNILNFPTGTARLTTTVKGAWKISNSTKYSTPKDYDDVETVTR